MALTAEHLEEAYTIIEAHKLSPKELKGIPGALLRKLTAALKSGTSELEHMNIDESSESIIIDLNGTKQKQNTSKN